MSWVRLDDGFAHNPKITQVGPAAAMLYIGSLCHCGKNLTDGFIAKSDVLLLAAVPNPPKLARRLVDAGLWAVVPGGYTIPDYLDYNPSREQITADREKRSKAGSAGAHSRWHGKSHSTSHSTSDSRGDGTVLGGMHGTVPNPLLGTNAAAGSKPTRELSQQPPHDEPDGADLLPGVLAGRGIHVTQRGLTRAQRDEIAQLAAIHGNSRLADSAYAQYQPGNPAGSIVAFLPGWRELPPPLAAIGPRLGCGHPNAGEASCSWCETTEAHA